MTKNLVAIVIIGLSAINCTSYKHWADMEKTRAQYREAYRADSLLAIEGIIYQIIAPFESAAFQNAEEVEPKYLIKHKYIDHKGDPVVLMVGDVVTPIVQNFNRRDIIRARTQAIRYLEPIIARVYKEEAQKGPVTFEQVAAKLVEHTPMALVVGGMYGLGKVASENAGNQVLTASEGSSVSYGSRGNKNTYHPVNETHIVEPEE
ncbi:MAG: hypothetical protein GWN00_01300 [Aliifodinibius sp.]|nr:hypothetical protein [Fodinibius sp.]NIV09968.1 hypothetical protein [Fodinibius sp.]NIY23498.1 hypothetical protein [Fodinibius sp.]